MPEAPIRSDVFKFVALRPPTLADKKTATTNFITDDRGPLDTPVSELTRTFDKDSPDKIAGQVQDFIKDHQYETSFLQDSELSKLYTLAAAYPAENFTAAAFKGAVEGVIGTTVAAYMAKPDTKATINKTWDRYYAFYLLSASEGVNLENLLHHLRVFHLLKNMETITPFTYDALQKSIKATPLVDKIFTLPPKPAAKKEQEETERNNTQAVKKYSQQWQELLNMHSAVNDVRNIRPETKFTIETRDITSVDRNSGAQVAGKMTTARNTLSLNRDNLEGLQEGTRAALRTLSLQGDNFQLPDLLSGMQARIGELSQKASSIKDPLFWEAMPDEAKHLPGLVIPPHRSADILDPYKPLIPPTNVRQWIKPLGIGDLKVVKQKLLKYVAGEVAHIENILRGEYKDREHRVLDRSEDIYTTAEETTEETTKDTQTTDRFELKKESEKTIQEQMSVEAGVTVSGSYGMVTFGAHGDFAYSTSTTESNKSSSNFAREVVDKSVSKIQKKTKQERVSKKLHEVEEINKHGFDNRGKPDHVTGIYRWVDKYYEAQVYNYGKRMMFEFIIPEPAAFFEFSLKNKSKKIPPPEGLPDGFTHKNINENNYQEYIKKYNVQGVTTPPPLYKTIATSIVKDSMPLDGNAHAINSTALLVPAGYISRWGVWWDMSAFWSHYPIVEVAIGNKIFRPLEYPVGGARSLGFNSTYPMANGYQSTEPFHTFLPETSIQLSVNTYDVISYTVNFYATLERSWEVYEQWQINTFEKIMAAYKAIYTLYEDKVRGEEAVQGITIQGQNPRINREIEKTELKKNCIKMLMDTYLYGSFDAMKEGGGTPPDFDIFDAMEEGKTIQFFEQAFEWENLTYLFYPYFWGRKDKWIERSTTYDTDPLFTKFRQAGAARVVLPVHPGYNDAVMYFLENNGAIWKGGEPPRLNDPLFISIAEELRDETDDLAGATPEGEPWEVVLPTTLVYLQQDATLPTF